MNTLHPSLPLPDPLRGSDAGTWAHHTVTTRLPRIAQRTLDENAFPPEAIAAVEALIAELPHGPIRPVEDSHAPDAGLWAGWAAPYMGQTWLDVPWFFAETYFYRRIIAAAGYYAPGPGLGRDPFALQKRRGLDAGAADTRTLAQRLETWLVPGADRAAALLDLLTLALWGNRVDLSLWPVGAGGAPGADAPIRQQAHLLVDDRQSAVDLLLGDSPARVDLIADNAGFELVCDLALACYLLDSGAAAHVRLHLKAHPTFVSDATAQDVRDTLAFLAADAGREAQALAGRLDAHLAAGRLTLGDDAFWTSPLALWDMPDRLRANLAASRLVIGKGDANYRRVLGDRHWPFDTPFDRIAAYLPAPLVALRTAKSEVMAGLPPGAAEQAAAQDPDWLVDGRWGMVQLARR
jgi:hypothetical protein